MSGAEQLLLFGLGRGGRNSLSTLKHKYYVYDRFTTPYPAGSVNNTNAEPVGGIRGIVDTNTRISISGGEFSLVSGTVANDGIRYTTGFPRALGRVLLTNITVPSTPAGRAAVGIDNNLVTAIREAISLEASSNLIRITTDGATTLTSVGVWVNGTAYQIAGILRASGIFWFIKGGVFTNYTLLFVTAQESNATIFPGLQSRAVTTVFVADNFRLTKNLYYVPTPIGSDGFSSLVTDGAGNPENNGISGLSYSQTGTWVVADGALSCSSLVDGLGTRVLETGYSDALIQINLTISGSNAGIIGRYQDPSTYLHAYVSGSNARLDSVVNGVPTSLVNAAVTYVANAPILLILDGTSARLLYNNILVGAISVTVPSSVQTRHGIITSNVGNSFRNFVIWARGNSINYYSRLDGF